MVTEFFRTVKKRGGEALDFEDGQVKTREWGGLKRERWTAHKKGGVRRGCQSEEDISSLALQNTRITVIWTPKQYMYVGE